MELIKLDEEKEEQADFITFLLEKMQCSKAGLDGEYHAWLKQCQAGEAPDEDAASDIFIEEVTGGYPSLPYDADPYETPLGEVVLGGE